VEGVLRWKLQSMQLVFLAVDDRVQVFGYLAEGETLGRLLGQRGVSGQSHADVREELFQ